ncbi:hypothetical protein JCM11491_002432 [Sporobolomyces phaffii]
MPRKDNTARSDPPESRNPYNSDSSTYEEDRLNVVLAKIKMVSHKFREQGSIRSARLFAYLKLSVNNQREYLAGTNEGDLITELECGWQTLTRDGTTLRDFETWNKSKCDRVPLEKPLSVLQ